MGKALSKTYIQSHYDDERPADFGPVDPTTRREENEETFSDTLRNAFFFESTAHGHDL